MKISKREKVMLSVLAIVLIGFFYYKFIYLNQTSKIADKSKNKNELEQKYNNIINTINSLDDKKSEIKILNTKVSYKADSFYPTISQEHLILELDKLLKDSGLEGGFIFNKIEVAEVPETEKTQENLKESTITQMTEKYNDKINSIIEKNNSSSESDNSKSESNSDESLLNDSKDTQHKSKSSSNSENSLGENDSNYKEEVEQIKFELNFSGSYASLDTFLNSIRNYERKIIVNSIIISEKTIDQVTGTMSLEIYAMPKINDDLEKYLNWTVNNIYGKSSPFSLDGSVGNVITDGEKTDSDFLVSVKSITSELPSIIMGKSNDKSKATYIYANNNDVEEVEIIITEMYDKYYYKYKTSNGSYPIDYNGLGEEFIVNSDNINIKVLSENRVNSNDKSGLKINIINKTDKLVNVEIDSDDSKNARVTVDGDSKNISVNNK
ncbi:pilus assembly protein PilO [Clostridium aquiflavi]|uniref:Pilus assembly protein PilO n=1 Tax=Clostridium aquiflavi TaxID=3073603 RepID=A0ABU1EJV1_9CLOT|nr:pilus assembly protein PilO [Clostridium sp. 5N-1]MDR5588675.1 pilus assembly protein PilO [Clostridium sp. 5N-1]